MYSNLEGLKWLILSYYAVLPCVIRESPVSFVTLTSVAVPAIRY
jgi:hypothetical protein